jgi:hypothetical protein
MLDDYNDKKDFMVEWVDIKGKLHKTKLIKKFISASAAAEYIYDNRKTCAKFPEAYWI